MLSHSPKMALPPPARFEMSDSKLLEAFVKRRDEAAFAALIDLHGPMVFGVCRRILKDHHDAEEAFQATFLIFSHKAASIMQRHQIGSWLYCVAYRTALRAQRLKKRRQLREIQDTDAPEPMANSTAEWSDIAPLLDHELNSLPEKYRVPVVLCDLEGRSHKEVAQELGCPEGTLSSRLMRARNLLAQRLSRQGVVMSVGAMTILITQHAASAAVPTTAILPIIQAAQLTALPGSVAGSGISPNVAQISSSVINSMFVSTLKQASIGLVLMAGLGIGAVELLKTSLALQPKAQVQVANEAVEFPEIKSCRFKMSQSLKNGEEKSETYFYWQAPSGIRSDSYENGKPVYDSIQPPGKAGVDIDHRNKGFAHHLRPNSQKDGPFCLKLLQWIEKYSGKPDQDLGTKAINGIETLGFSIATPKVDPDFPDGVLRIWYLPETKRPVHVEMELNQADKPSVTVCEDFAWNEPADKWFEVSIPDGYQDRTRKENRNSYTTAELTEDDVVVESVKAFKIYAKYCGGKYPQANIIYPDSTRDQVFKRAGISTRWKEEYIGNSVANECFAVQMSFSTIYGIQMNNQDSAYFGKQVGPGDTNKVLFRWKRDDGQYSVIFGDLHYGKVNREALQIEGGVEALRTGEKLEAITPNQQRLAELNQQFPVDNQRIAVPNRVLSIFIFGNVLLLGGLASFFVVKRLRKR